MLSFEGIHNFRDYGDYACNGGKLRSGRLYRSSQHRDATPADLAKVASLALAAVVDLRGASERKAAPCPRPANFSARVIFVDAETAGLAPHLEAARDLADPADALSVMRSAYAAMPFRPILVRVLRDYFGTLAEVDGPTLVHCMAGKDRTGLAVALLHRMLGVHGDDLVDDFLLTNTTGDAEARIAAGARAVRRAFGKDLSEDTLKVVMSVDASYLDAAFSAIDARYGDFDRYLFEACGVDGLRREAIAGRLLA